MNKLELSEEGNNYRLNLQVALKWLFIGGELAVEGGHVLLMDNDGRIGFKITTFKNGMNNPGTPGIMQLGSDTALMFLVSHARKMTEKDRFVMAANLTLNEV